MDAAKTALLMIGFQNDYFASDGILHGVVEESSRINGTLGNTLDLLKRVEGSPMLLVSTPILFTEDYSELAAPVGILEHIKEVGAFKAGTRGSETIDELQAFEQRIVEVPGKRGLNAFSNTQLETLLREHDIDDVVLAGTVTSICIDSTGRSAHERGYRVSILSDCTSARTNFEQEFYCEQIFPLYADVLTHEELLRELGLDRQPRRNPTEGSESSPTSHSERA